MTLYEDIVIRPIGVVKSQYTEPKKKPTAGVGAVIEVFPEYAGALTRIEEHSHMWILSWFHLARRDCLLTTPGRVNTNLPKYGVFGMRSPARPNPIGLSLVKLNRIEGNRLYVTGLDAVNGSPVIDIKPYFENDIIFSPLTPYIAPLERERLREMLLRLALVHHQEECPDLFLAVRMAVLAGEKFGHLNSPDLYIKVEGSPCLADTLQGLTRARLANPPRFEYRSSDSFCRSIWRQGNEELSIMARRRIDREEFLYVADDDLLDIYVESL